MNNYTKKQFYKPPKVKPSERLQQQKLPEWNSLQNDENKYKLSKTAQLRKALNAVSKNLDSAKRDWRENLQQIQTEQKLQKKSEIVPRHRFQKDEIKYNKVKSMSANRIRKNKDNTNIPRGIISNDKEEEIKMMFNDIQICGTKATKNPLELHGVSHNNIGNADVMNQFEETLQKMKNEIQNKNINNEKCNNNNNNSKGKTNNRPQTAVNNNTNKQRVQSSKVTNVKKQGNPSSGQANMWSNNYLKERIVTNESKKQQKDNKDEKNNDEEEEEEEEEEEYEDEEDDNDGNTNNKHRGKNIPHNNKMIIQEENKLMNIQDIERDINSKFNNLSDCMDNLNKALDKSKKNSLKMNYNMEFNSENENYLENNTHHKDEDYEDMDNYVPKTNQLSKAPPKTQNNNYNQYNNEYQQQQQPQQYQPHNHNEYQFSQSNEYRNPIDDMDFVSEYNKLNYNYENLTTNDLLQNINKEHGVNYKKETQPYQYKQQIPQQNKINTIANNSFTPITNNNDINPFNQNYNEQYNFSQESKNIVNNNNDQYNQINNNPNFARSINEYENERNDNFSKTFPKTEMVQQDYDSFNQTAFPLSQNYNNYNNNNKYNNNNNNNEQYIPQNYETNPNSSAFSFKETKPQTTKQFPTNNNNNAYEDEQPQTFNRNKFSQLSPVPVYNALPQSNSIKIQQNVFDASKAKAKVNVDELSPYTNPANYTYTYKPNQNPNEIIPPEENSRLEYLKDLLEKTKSTVEKLTSNINEVQPSFNQQQYKYQY